MKTERCPKIDFFSTSKNFKYLWLKYVTGFDLSVHCANCLIGNYSKKIPIKDNTVLLDEFEAKYYYLCGVSIPYKWEDNLHIAFRYKEGGCIQYNDGHTRVVISDAEAIKIKSLNSYDLHPKGKLRLTTHVGIGGSHIKQRLMYRYGQVKRR